MSFAAPVELEL